MTQQELLGLMDKFAAGTITRLQYEESGTRLVLEKGTACAPKAQPAPMETPPQAEEECYIKTPLVGTFYAAPEPGKPAYVKAGDTVKKGQIVCIIEAMKMINEVPAPYDCVIEKALMQDGSLVGYGEPLFVVREL